MKPRDRLCLVLKSRMTAASVEPSLSFTACHLITVCIMHKDMPRQYKLHHFTLWSVIHCLLQNSDGLITLLYCTSDDLVAVSRQTDGKKQEDRFYVQNGNFYIRVVDLHLLRVLLLLENGESNKCRHEFDIKYKLSTDTNQIRIYARTLVETHNAVFNRSACGRPSYFYILHSLFVKRIKISTNRNVTLIRTLTFLHVLCLYPWNVWLSHSMDKRGIVALFQIKARVPSNVRSIQSFFRANPAACSTGNAAVFLWKKWLQHESAHSTPSTAEPTDEGRCISTVSCACAPPQLHLMSETKKEQK